MPCRKSSASERKCLRSLRTGQATPWDTIRRAGCDHGSMTEPISERALNRALLARQHLLERTNLSSREVIEHLVVLQAQVPVDPYVCALDAHRGP